MAFTIKHVPRLVWLTVGGTPRVVYLLGVPSGPLPSGRDEPVPTPDTTPALFPSPTLFPSPNLYPQGL